MKHIKISNFVSAILLSLTTVSLTFATNIASPLNIQGNIHSEIMFDRTEQGSDEEWQIYGDNNHLSMRDDVNDTDHNSKLVFELQHSFNNENSFILNSSGDINLANGSVFIDRSENRIGIGTPNPEAGLHIKDSVPTITLETPDDSKWTFQAAYRLIGPKDDIIQVNNLTIFDHSSNTRPWEIQEGAPNSSFVIKNNGYIGLGTAAPIAKLDVVGTTFLRGNVGISGDTLVVGELNITKEVTVNMDIDNNSNHQRAFTMSANNSNAAKMSDVSFVIENKREDFSWQIRTYEPSHSISINKQGTGQKELIITGVDEPNGMELLLANGAKNSGGQWLDASSRAYKENIKELDSKTAMEAFHKLEPVTYNYKTNKAEPIVGFIAEDVPEVVATNDRDALSALEMVALLTKVVQIQEKEIQELQKMNEKVNMMEHILLR